MASGTAFDFSLPVARPILVLDESELEKLDVVDDESADASGSNVNSSKQLCHVNSARLNSASANTPQYVLIGSLLEHICTMYESNPEKSKKLFKTICLQLQKLNMVSPLSYLEEYSSIRLQYKASFYNLMQSSILQVNPNLALSSDPQPNVNNSLMKSIPSFSTNSFFKFTASRYEEEFEELSELGVGAFGKVYKARNKMDHQEYAIKKIHFKSLNANGEPQAVKKIMREVKSLASLQHPHVVRYHCAWMEHHYSDTTVANNDTSDKCNISAAECSSHSSSKFLGVPNNVFKNEDFHNECGAGDSNSGSWHEMTNDTSFASVHNRKPSKFWQIGDTDEDEVSISTSKITISKESGVAEFEKTCSTSPPNDVIVTEGVRRVSCFKRVQSFIVNTATKSHLHTLVSDHSEHMVRSRSLNSMKDAKILAEINVSENEPVLHLLPTEIVLYIQMQLCESSLQRWLTQRNDSLNGGYDIDEAKAFDIFRQLLTALEYIHGKEILHRDLKPRNILINGIRPHIFLGDFGLSRPVLPRYSSEVMTPVEELSEYCFDLEEHTSGVGTTVYASPEQLKHENYDYKADMYSAGIIFFELTWPLHTGHQRGHLIPGLRDGIISDLYKKKWPEAVEILQDLTSHDPLKRPSANDLLNKGLFLSRSNKLITRLNKDNAKLQEDKAKLQKEKETLQQEKINVQSKNAYLIKQNSRYRSLLTDMGIDPED